jgi:hypothetical protein
MTNLFFWFYENTKWIFTTLFIAIVVIWVYSFTETLESFNNLLAPFRNK